MMFHFCLALSTSFGRSRPTVFPYLQGGGSYSIAENISGVDNAWEGAESPRQVQAVLAGVLVNPNFQWCGTFRQNIDVLRHLLTVPYAIIAVAFLLLHRTDSKSRFQSIQGRINSFPKPITILF